MDNVQVTDSELPATGRARAIIGAILTLAPTVVVAIGGPAWVWLHPGAFDPGAAGGVAMLLSFLSAAVLALQPSEFAFPGRRLHGQDERWWTTRTLTGMRTIDLHRLRTIRYFVLPHPAWGRLPAREYLVLTDTRRARLFVDSTDPKVIKILRRALPHADAVRISPQAARLLDIEPTMRNWTADRMVALIYVFPLLVTLITIVLSAAVLTS
jgi:hypothetical protein